MKRAMILGLLALSTLACGQPGDQPAGDKETDVKTVQAPAGIDALLEKYTTFQLTTDLAVLSEKERQMLPLLIEAVQHMDAAFWQQAYGDRDALLAAIADPKVRRFAEINYGPWDRLDGDKPFVEGVGPKPEGAGFYPADMSKQDFEAAVAESPERAAVLKSQYTVVRRGEGGALEAVPYSQAYAEHYQAAAEKLRAAAELAEDAGLKRYLELRAEALLSDDYLASDLAWMEMKTNTLDVVIGPIETYEDQLFGYKAASEGYVLVKDQAWSARLAKYAALLPALQKGLPVADEYKTETPGTDSDLNAYDVVYYAGDCNAGSKTIAINLPNDERVQLEKGTRRLQLKNAMRAKFDKILVPIAGLLIDEDQRAHITFDAFFADTMFHEVAHGLGIKNTIHGSGTVRDALKEHASVLEEGKADVLGLYMITKLREQGELGEAPLADYQTTFMAGIFRSIRFGSSSAHGVTNLIRFNFFKEMGAFERNPATDSYRVHPEKFGAAVDALSERILRLQGDGDYAAVAAFIDQYGKESPELREDLDRLAGAGIPVDVIFEQGVNVLGLAP
ncbi:MAG: Zn-dependent hydrolase [Thermoanaerobaculia bacterium]|nr:Zn-dependent hydrolase [Thermoanaerobaculia bacterium]